MMKAVVAAALLVGGARYVKMSHLISAQELGKLLATALPALAGQVRVQLLGSLKQDILSVNADLDSMIMSRRLS